MLDVHVRGYVVTLAHYATPRAVSTSANCAEAYPLSADVAALVVCSGWAN